MMALREYIFAILGQNSNCIICEHDSPLECQESKSFACDLVEYWDRVDIDRALRLQSKRGDL